MSTLSWGRSLTGIVAASALACSMTLGAVQTVAADDLDPNTDTTTQTPGVDNDSVIVRLTSEPLATSTKVNRGQNKKVDLAGAKTKNERAALAKQRNNLRAWLRTNAPKATITGEYDFALNAVAVRLNGTKASVLEQAPGVAEVSVQQVFTKAATDPDLALIDAPQGWAAAGATSVSGNPSTWAGHGVKVGVVDSGIDTAHPCFDDTGFPATTQLGDRALTNNKVIVAKVFNNKLNQNGFTAKAIDDHGTHVAGTIACNLRTPAVVEGAQIPYDPSGVAPGAQLGNYNVFPGNVESARSEDIVGALNAAAIDGMDVINMSLGGGAHSARDIYSNVITNLDKAGIVVSIAQGNDGPGYFTGGSPGTAPDAITVGASSVGHYVGTPILHGEALVTVAAIGEFPLPTSNLTAVLGVVASDDATLGEACEPLPAGSLTGKIALVSRGTCSFGTKVKGAEDAGARAVIVVNNAPGDPAAMATDAAFPSTIPAVMAGLDSRMTLMALEGQQITLGSDKAYRASGNDNILMSFSSWGPVPVTYGAKPDVVAPGGNVISSLPLSHCAGQPSVAVVGCWGLMSGTSMATPHVSGMAAVVKQAHPTWSAAQVRSAIANTATVDAVKQTSAITTPERDVLKVGNGLADLDAAVNATLALSSTTVSFGSLPKSAAQRKTQTITVTNLTGSAVTVPVSIADASGPGFSVDKSSLTVPANGSAKVTVTWASPKKAASSVNQAHLVFGEAAHVVLFAALT